MYHMTIEFHMIFLLDIDIYMQLVTLICSSDVAIKLFVHVIAFSSYRQSSALFVLFQFAIFAYACPVVLCGGVTFFGLFRAGDKGGEPVKPVEVGGDGATCWLAACEGAKWNWTPEPDILFFVTLLEVGQVKYQTGAY